MCKPIEYIYLCSCKSRKPRSLSNIILYTSMFIFGFSALIFSVMIMMILSFFLFFSFPVSFHLLLVEYHSGTYNSQRIYLLILPCIVWYHKVNLRYPCLHLLLQKEWRDRRDDFKKKVSRCVRKSQEML